jgi:hypothetical protein
VPEAPVRRRTKGRSRAIQHPGGQDSDGAPRSETVAFAHYSERQFARLLDFYQIEWEYEPRSFDIEWDAEDNVTQRFTPDFYLPAYDQYIEITTLNQKLVTKKNRKVRRLRERYPEVRCKIFYQRDYLSLLVKYGLESPGSVPPGVQLDPPPGGLDLTGNGDGNGEKPLRSGGTPEAAKPRAS